jgi:hypothetical protein
VAYFAVPLLLLAVGLDRLRVREDRSVVGSPGGEPA